MSLQKYILPSLAVTATFVGCMGGEKNKSVVHLKSSKPNIVFILADDLGYGDLSCYSQKQFKTPHIDRMAEAGMLFTQHYSGCTVSAPSRSSLMTGLTTGHSPIRGNREWKPEGQWPMPAGTFTVAEMLKNAGYVTGGFGKWGLGYPGSEGDANMQGFDQFYGYNCQRKAHNYYPAYLWDNQVKVMLEGNKDNKFEEYAPDLIHKQALQFIEKNNPAKTGKPFFLYFASTLPHAELLLPDKYMKEFRGKFLPEKSFKGIDYGDQGFRDGGYGSQTECHAAFAAMVTHLDRQVGEILEKLKELGLDKNTIVIFSSDNGPHLEGGADPDYFDSNGPLKGNKRDLYEGGIRVPMIAWWPGKIQAGTRSGHISAFWDFFPTACELAGVASPDSIDGISFLPELFGKTQRSHQALYFEFNEQGGKQAIIKDGWKCIRFNVKSPEKETVELYHLQNDLKEQINLATKFPEKVEELLSLMKNSRTESENFKLLP